MELFRVFGAVEMRDEASPAMDRAERSGKGLSGTLGKLGPLVGGVALALGGVLVANIKAGIDGISEYQDQTAQLEAVLKSTGGQAGVTSQQVKDLADKMQLSTKYTAEAALETSNLLLTFTNIGAGVFEDTVSIAADMATALGTDMSGSAIQLGKALNDPINGLTALTRVGVTFTEEQKNAITAMQESGDMAGAQTVILQELQKEFGGSAEAAGKTFSGQLEILKNSFGEVQESIAAGLMPYLQQFAEYIVAHMPEIQAFVTEAMEVTIAVFTEAWRIISKIIDVLVQLYKLVEPYMPAIAKFTEDAMKGIVNSVMFVIEAFEWLIDIIGDALQALKEFQDADKTSAIHGDKGGGGRSFANGGRFGAGQVMRVGEAGPELVAFGASGTVIPNRDIRGGGTVVNNYFTVNDGFNGVKREMNRMGWATP